MKSILALLLLCSSTLFAQTGAELPAISQANHNDFFIPDTACKKYKLELGQNDDWMKVYNNFTDNATIERVNDIRWQAKDKAEAMKWYKENTALLSEGADDITSQLSRPVGVDSWTVYGASKSMREMMKSLGVAQNQYNFTFTVDQYIVKIFVATTEKQTLKDAWQFAKEGLKATLTAAGKKKLADLVL
jgi:hypothetical protein